MKEKIERNISKDLSLIINISERFFEIQKELKVSKGNEKLEFNINLILAQLSSIEDSILNFQEDMKKNDVIKNNKIN